MINMALGGGGASPEAGRRVLVRCHAGDALAGAISRSLRYYFIFLGYLQCSMPQPDRRLFANVVARILLLTTPRKLRLAMMGAD